MIRITCAPADLNPQSYEFCIGGRQPTDPLPQPFLFPAYIKQANHGSDRVAEGQHPAAMARTPASRWHSG
jgi:hypothetical protein